MAEPLSVSDFSSKIKEKYSQYEGIDDEKLARAIVEKHPEYADKVKFGDDPTLGEVGAGLVADVALAEGMKYAGGAGGAAIGSAVPVVGTAVGGAIGYGLGAISGGVTGSIAAQKIEGRDDISWGRVVGDTILNFIPGSKLAKTGSVGSRVLKAGGTQAAIGAVTAPAAQSVESLIETGKMPTKEELAKMSATGAALGFGLGGASVGIDNLIGKVGGKTVDEVDEMIATGDLTFRDFERIDPEAGDILRREVEKSAQAKQSQMAMDEILRSKEIASGQRGMAGKIFASIAPSKVVKRKSQQAAIDFQRDVKTAEELGSRMARNIEKKISGDGGLNVTVNKIIDGELQVGDLSPDQIKKLGSSVADLKKYEELRLSKQKEMLSLLESGAYRNLDADAQLAMRKALQESIGGKAYNRREYKMFLDKDFKEDESMARAAYNELSATMGERKAKEHMDKLRNSSASTRDSDPRTFFGSPVDSVLKARHNPGAAERAWLGEVTEAPERIRGTLSGMGKSVARAKADQTIARSLLEDGIASTQKSEGMVELVLRGTGSEGTGIYVNPETQVALNQIYLPDIDRGTENVVINGLQDLYRASVAGSKASKVLLNTIAYPVQLYGNTASLIGMGVNPFNIKNATRGFDLALSEFGGVEALRKNPAARKRMLDDIEEMSKYGIKNANIVDSDLRNTLDNGIFSKMLSKATDPLGKLYSVPDTMGRYIGWKSNQNALRKIFPDASDEVIKREAAHLINDTYQNYDKLSNVVRTLSRWGVMPQFASFTAEFARNQYNQGKVITQMLRGSYQPSSSLGRASVPAMRAEGAKRLAAITAVYGTTYGAIEGVKAASGIGQEEEDAIRDLAYAPWEKNKEQMVKYDKETRKGWTANPSYIVPHAIGLSAFKAGMRGDDEATVMGMLSEELMGEGSFIMQAAYQAVHNQDKRGEAISNEIDEVNNAAERAKYFIAESFRPGISREFKKATAAAQGRGDLTLRDVGNRQLGLRSNAFDMEKSAKFSIKNNYDPAKSEASDYYSLIKYKDPSPDESNRAYETAERIRQESFAALAKNKRSMQTLKFSDDEIIKTMKDAGVSSKDILGLMDGSYTPLPRVKIPSPTSIYEELEGSRNDKRKAILDIMKTDRAMGNQLMSRWQRDGRQNKLSERDQLLRNLSVAERVSYLKANPSKLRELQRKGIATNAVMEAYRLSSK